MFTRVAGGVLLASALGGWLLVAAAPPSVAIAAPKAGAAHGEHSSAPKAEDSLNPLKSWRADLAIWTAVVFLILLLVLGKFAWGPIRDGLDRREQGIADQVSEAERHNQEAKELLAQYGQKLADAQAEIRKMIEQGRRDADEIGRQIVAKAREDAEGEHQRALREIEEATAGSLKELSELSATLAVELAGKIVGAELKPEDHAQLIAGAVAEFPGAKAGANGNT